jgi:hypothetical protein
MPDQLPDVRAGQLWLLPTGEQVFVNGVDGNQVDGTLTNHGIVMAWIKARRDLAGATLLRPLFRVRITGPDDERAWKIAELAGAIGHRSIGPTGCAYFIDAAAADGRAALERVRERCSLDPRFDVSAASLVAPNAPLD